MFAVNSYSRERFYIIKQYQFILVTKLIFIKNLISDKLVLVWKLRFWTSVIKWEYIWMFCKIMEFGKIINISSLFYEPVFLFSFPF